MPPTTRGRSSHGIRAALLAGLAATLSGCGGQPFPGSVGDLDELGRGVLAAFTGDDDDALAAFRLTEAEHNEVVWPELPASRGENPFPLDLAWRNIQLRDRRAIPRTRAVLRSAEPLEFDGVECEGETQRFETFVVHTDCRVGYRSYGRLYRHQIFKDVLERNGGFKIFRYYDEDPELVNESAQAAPSRRRPTRGRRRSRKGRTISVTTGTPVGRRLA